MPTDPQWCPSKSSGYQPSRVVQTYGLITQLSVLYKHLKGKAHVNYKLGTSHALAIPEGLNRGPFAQQQFLGVQGIHQVLVVV